VATESPPWSPPCSGRLRPNQGTLWCSNDSTRDGASARPRRFVDLVLDRAHACAMLADVDGSVAISVDLLFLATPGCSPPSLVMCVAWHGPGRGLAPPWLACATVLPWPPLPLHQVTLLLWLHLLLLLLLLDLCLLHPIICCC
jgi:hypothetical protein